MKDEKCLLSSEDNGENCLECKSATECTKCGNNNFLNGGYCYDCSDKGNCETCSATSNKCDECEKG